MRLMERIRPIDFSPSHVTTLRVPLYEVDIGGGVYHGNYFHLFEIARDDFFRSIGFPYIRLVEEYDMHLTVAQVSCAYFQPLRYDDLVDVHTGVREIKTRSIVIIQRIDRFKKPCTQAEFAMVCISPKKGVLSIPESFRNAIKSWMDTT